MSLRSGPAHPTGFARAVVALTLLVAAACLLGVAPSLAAADPVAADVARMEMAAGAPLDVARSRVTGLVTFVSTSSAPIPVSAPAASPAEARARAFVASYGGAFGIALPGDLGQGTSTGPDEVGIDHVRFRQLHRGVPVTGGELTVHLAGAGVVVVNAKTLEIAETIDTSPAISAADALRRAQAFIAKRFEITDAVLSQPRLEVFNRGMLEDISAPTHLAWFIEAHRLDLRQFIWIDAHTGRRLLDFSQLTDALSRRIYTANGGSTLPGTLIRSEGQGPTGDLDGDAGYNFAGDTYNYFLTQHGRDSYDGAGAMLISTVHYCPTNDGCNYQNAFWNGVQMVFGNGFSRADDVVAHELAHAVTEHSANLFYYMQSGALNESYSDIFGETIDLLNGAGTDTAGVRWLVGEDIPGIGAFRNMMNPHTFNDPAKMSDPQFVCATPGSDAGGVHTNSGVPNHAYALMVDGGSYSGFTVAGIGLTKAGKIHYRALTTYLLSASGFLDHYNAVKRSCTDLIGVAGITAADCAEVGKALDAVELASPWPCSPPTPAVPAFCPASQAPVDLFADDLENLASGNWAISTFTGPNLWYYPGSVNPYGFGPFATSGVTNFWGDDAGTVADSVIAMTSSVPIPTGGARLQFNHAFGFENPAFDGGVIEYSTNGGASWSDAGGLITAGATYRGTIASGWSNPLAGRSAFVGDSFGYTASQLNLASLAGQSIRFRFRIGTDVEVEDYGWFIDDVRIYRCVANTVALRDFNGDARADILWKHTSGEFGIWLMNGPAIIGNPQFGNVGAQWTPVGVGDFNGDGKADILWKDTAGNVGIWLMNGGTIIGSPQLGNVGTSWNPAGVGDFNGDGKADILWRHTSGEIGIWLMSSGTIIGNPQFGNVGSQWTPVGVGDFNGDGKADILWKDTAGSLGIWLMNGGTIIGSPQLGNVGTAWTPVRVADFNGDGKSDVLWRHTSGDLGMWLMDGGTIVGTFGLGNVPLGWTTY